MVDADLHPEGEVNLAMVGKYMELLDAYKSLNEAITHAGIKTRTKVNVTYIDSADVLDKAQRYSRAWMQFWFRVDSESAVSKVR